MRHDKLQRELDLLLLLVENHNYTALDLCERLNITRRNLYYYLNFFRSAGFEIIKSGYFYRLDRSSSFFRKLHESIDFTEDEAIFLRQLLQGANHNHPLVQRIEHKLDRFYDLRILTDEKLQVQRAQNISVIYEAIKLKQVIKICNYSSPSSHSIGDRVIEPFQFLNNNADVRGFELSSGKNKTYKVARMEKVELIDLLWSHEAEHREVFTDIFLFSGEQTFPIKLRLGQLAYSLLKEEYPPATAFLTPDDEKHWLLQLDVCDYRGIGRFVLGLWEDIEVLGDDGFKSFLQEKISKMSMNYTLADK